MSDIVDYETDILLWSERQAVLLRRLKTRAPGVSNELDVENLAEEIEGVGRSEFRAFESYLIQIFIHLIKAASNPDPRLRADCESEIFGFQHEAIKAMTPLMVGRFDKDGAWRYSLHKAAGELRKYDETLDGVPRACPFDARQFLVPEPIDLAPLLALMRERADLESQSD